MGIAVIDTSAFLLFFDRRFDVIDHLEEVLEERMICITTDSVIRELYIHGSRLKAQELFGTYIEKIFSRCTVISLAEDFEREDADHDLIRAAKILGGYIVTLDKEIKRIARRESIQIMIYRESKSRLEIE